VGGTASGTPREPAMKSTSGFRSHDVPHPWASWHRQSGASCDEVRDLCGWKLRVMVDTYAKFATEHLAAAAERIERGRDQNMIDLSRFVTFQKHKGRAVRLTLEFNGRPCRDRTYDQRIKSTNPLRRVTTVYHDHPPPPAVALGKLRQNARFTPTRETYKTMKLLAIGFVALLSLPIPSLAQNADALDGRLKTIRDSQAIGIAYRTDAPPFSFEANKEIIGYSIDLCRRVVNAIERQLGISELKIRWVPVNGQTRFEAIAKGQADMECGASTVTLGRMKTVDFSSFTFIDGTGLIVKASLAANALSDLGGKKIGVISATSNEQALNDALKNRVINATVVPVKSREEGLEQVESGAIDAFASDRVLLIALVGKSKDPKGLAVLADALSFEPYAIGLPRGDWQMRLAVNSALAQIYRGGAIREIFGRWFGSLGRPGPVMETAFLFGALPE